MAGTADQSCHLRLHGCSSLRTRSSCYLEARLTTLETAVLGTLYSNGPLFPDHMTTLHFQIMTEDLTSKR